MPVKKDLSAAVNRKKRIIGVIAVALLLVITALAIFLKVSFIVWVIADLVVAGVANLLLRRIGRTPS